MEKIHLKVGQVFFLTSNPYVYHTITDLSSPIPTICREDGKAVYYTDLELEKAVFLSMDFEESLQFYLDNSEHDSITFSFSDFCIEKLKVYKFKMSQQETQLKAITAAKDLLEQLGYTVTKK